MNEQSMIAENSIAASKRRNPHHRMKGFSMIELLIATVVFTIVAGAAFGLFINEEPVYQQQTALAGLSISLNNAIAQIQLDLTNAGTGVFPGADVPNWPIGVTIQNSQPAANCYNAANFTYTTSCFDSMSIVTAATNVPPLHPSVIGTNCVSTTSSTLFANPAPGDTAAQDASQFNNGDELLLLKSDGSSMTAVVLTSAGSVSGSKIQLSHNPTGTTGVSPDPLGIAVNPNNKLGTTFCSNDWIIKLNGISYYVDASNPNDPILMRQQGGVANQVADQIIGFKIGAALWNSASSTSSDYNYNSAWYVNPALTSAPCAGSPDTTDPCDPYDYTLIRSVRVSLIGRTDPSSDPTYKFRNLFDGGPYQIQGLSIVVDPRNLSMND